MILELLHYASFVVDLESRILNALSLELLSSLHFSICSWNNRHHLHSILTRSRVDQNPASLRISRSACVATCQYLSSPQHRGCLHTLFPASSLTVPFSATITTCNTQRLSNQENSLKNRSLCHENSTSHHLVLALYRPNLATLTEFIQF